MAELHPDYVPRLKRALDAFPIPRYMHEGVLNWITDGIPPGSFLTAVLENDLMEACARADAQNQRALFHYASFLYNHAPLDCYGSKREVAAWGGKGLKAFYDKVG